MGLKRKVDSIKELNEEKQQREEIPAMVQETQMGLIEAADMVADLEERMDENALALIELANMLTEGANDA